MSKTFTKIERQVLLKLDQNPKLGAKTLARIVHHYKSDLSRVLVDSAQKLARFFDVGATEAIIESRKNQSDIELFEKLEIQTVFLGDDEYPEMLAEIYDPPMILYCRGDISTLNSKSLAVVGSRKHSYYSKAVLEKFIPELVAAKLSIVSGLAIGVDGLAHFLTLENVGITIGVLGSGVDQVYPSSNRVLGERIISNGGAIISEFPPGTVPFKQNFPLRNRIIAGMTLGTLIVEARHDSGSLITAGLANEFGREVFAVPGNIDSFSSEGTNALLKQGAKITTDASDILSELEIEGVGGKEKILIAETPEESIIFEKLSIEPMPIDKISKEVKLDIVTLNSLMTILEIAGKVEKTEKGFRLKGKYQKSNIKN